MGGHQYAHLPGVITFFSSGSGEHLKRRKESVKRDKVRIVFFLERSLLMLYGEVCAYKLDSYKSFEGIIF